MYYCNSKTGIACAKFGHQYPPSPDSLGNCSELTYLELGGNNLTGAVPFDLGKLSLLERLYLNDNQLVSGNNTTLPILTALTNCSNLRELVLEDNYLSGILPVSIGQLSTKLSMLHLDGNYIRGEIPQQIANLTNLTFLDLSFNNFTGCIPKAVGSLQNLERLYLDVNRLEGNIPSDIGQLKTLGVLSLGNNILSGPIPDTLGNLQKLRMLILNDNQLWGNIPASLGNCFVLEAVDLSNNKLNGSIPPEVAGLPNLQVYLNLSRNSLQGALPPEISKMEHVLDIDISVNRLSGHIPATLGGCTQLQYLNLSWNAFQGPIPNSLGQLKSLEDMDLSSNNLSGTIPESLEALKMLRFLNFSFNNFTGEIPKQGIFANLTATSFMGNSALCGSWIHLPACPALTQKRQRHSLDRNRIIIPIVTVVAALLVLSCLILYWRRCSQKHLFKAIELKTGHIRISYEELVNATDRFSEGNLLGTGSFGSVYKGTLSDGTVVAVKVLNLQSEAAGKSFIAECRILRRDRHRNLVKIITSCSNHEFKGLILQFMPNGSLEDCLYHDSSDSNAEDECGLNFSQRLNIAIDVAHGMEYLHHHCSEQVVHCDLKPSNVLLDNNMMALVGDFGIAKLISANTTDSLTSTLALKGSIGYIAPEYGMGERISIKGDVYSYGILLLEMLTRKRPTSDMFVGGMDLRNWVSMAFPHGLVEVVDDELLRDLCGDETLEENERYKCLVSLICVGLLCTKESPQERPTMREVVRVLESIRAGFNGDTIRASGLMLPSISSLLEGTRTVGNEAGEADSPSSSTL
eukprot:Gb_17630 [translate_table: standard]